MSEHRVQLDEVDHLRLRVAYLSARVAELETKAAADAKFRETAKKYGFSADLNWTFDDATCSLVARD